MLVAASVVLALNWRPPTGSAPGELRGAGVATQRCGTGPGKGRLPGMRTGRVGPRGARTRVRHATRTRTPSEPRAPRHRGPDPRAPAAFWGRARPGDAARAGDRVNAPACGSCHAGTGTTRIPPRGSRHAGARGRDGRPPATRPSLRPCPVPAARFLSLPGPAGPQARRPRACLTSESMTVFSALFVSMTFWKLPVL